MTQDKTKRPRYWPYFLAVLINKVLITSFIVGVILFLLPKAEDMMSFLAAGTSETQVEEGADYVEPAAGSDGDSSNFVNEPVEALQIQSEAVFTAQESTVNLAELSDLPDNFSNYWAFRSYLASHVNELQTLVGSTVEISSPNNIGGDTEALFSDETQQCTVQLATLAYDCVDL